jgi:ATP/maltotriose-dependent transcriptional regulator MalT
VTTLAVAVNLLCQAVALSGASEEAARLISEAEAIADATGSPVVPAGALVLAALQGREPDASNLIDVTIERATAGGQGIAVQFAVWARSVVLNGLGRYREALAAARDASDDGPELFVSYVSTWALIELIEAATRCDDLDVAGSALDRLTERTGASDSDWGLGVEARSRALVSDGEEAEALYREAIERLGQTRLRPELARAHLLYGEWLRRDRRRIDARDQLRQAQDMFTSIGMEAFAARAGRELLATGETARKRTDQTRDELTAQKLQIAHLARDRLSNADIGARLFISPRTVEYHLHKVFTKLGITSRERLDRVLPGA